MLTRTCTDVELWIRTGPHRVDISDDTPYSPDVLDDWLAHAIRAIITIDSAIRTLDANSDAT